MPRDLPRDANRAAAGRRSTGRQAVAETLRRQRSLLELAAMERKDFGAGLEVILRTDASALGVERVSFWSLDEAEQRIVCEALYHTSRDAFERGAALAAADHPAYFRALRADPLILAHDALRDPRTCEFADGYLAPHGITSMMDVPVWVRGRLAGVVCHEHVGPARRWTDAEEEFALSIGHMTALSLEARDRARAEEGLRQSEERFRLLVQGVRDFAIVMLEPDGRVATWNAGAERLTGFRADEIVGASVAKFYRAADATRGRPQRELATAAAEGRLEAEAWRVRRDGTQYWASVAITALRDADGRLRGYAYVLREASDRDRAAEALEFLAEPLDVRSRLQSLACAAVPGLADACVVDRVEAGGQASRVATVVAEGMAAGLREALAVELPLADAQVYDDSGAEPELVADIGRAAAAPGAPAYLAALRARGFESLIRVPLVGREESLGVVVLLGRAPRPAFGPHDVQAAGDLLRPASLAADNARLYEEAQRAIRVRDDFLSIASHEMRTPLTTLALQLSSIERLLRRDIEGLDPRVRPRLQTAMRQTDRLARLVESLLDVSRISTGRFQLELEDVDLVALVRDAVDRFAEQAAHARCTLEVLGDAPVCGRFDRVRLEQTVTNLLSNAVKYAPGTAVTLQVEQREARAVLTVTDHGIGIAPAQLPRIFERFTRAVSPEHYGGLGLGLYITREIVEAHGGTIRAESTPGHGATFIVELPLFPARRNSDRPAPR